MSDIPLGVRSADISLARCVIGEQVRRAVLKAAFSYMMPDQPAEDISQKEFDHIVNAAIASLYDTARDIRADRPRMVGDLVAT